MKPTALEIKTKILNYFEKEITFDELTGYLDQSDKATLVEACALNHEGSFMLLKIVRSQNVSLLKYFILKRGISGDLLKKIESEHIRFGGSLVCNSVFEKNFEMTTLLLDAGLDPNVYYGWRGGTPLYWAVFDQEMSQQLKLQFVEMFLDRGANPNIINDRTFESILYVAVENANNAKNCPESIQIIKQLIEKGADVNVDIGFSNSPILKATVDGNLEVLKLLFDKGAKLEIYEEGKDDLDIPIVKAIKHTNAEVTAFLIQKTIEQGGNLTTRTSNRKSPLDMLHSQSAEFQEKLIAILEKKECQDLGIVPTNALYYTSAFSVYRNQCVIL